MNFYYIFFFFILLTFNAVAFFNSGMMVQPCKELVSEIGLHLEPNTELQTEGPVPGSLTITLSNPPCNTVEVGYFISGTAVSSQHDLVDGSISIPKGQTSATIDFNFLDNATIEGIGYIHLGVNKITSKSNVLIDGQYAVRQIILDDESSFTTALQIETGTVRACAIMQDSKLKCWGRNINGMLGDGTTVTRYSPVPVDSSTTYKTLEFGWEHSCGITTSDDLKCWGDNTAGEVGNGTTSAQLTPTIIDSGTKYSKISAGATHTCGITTGGVLKCWGYGFSGRLGLGTTTDHSTPQVVDSGISYQSVTASGNHTCAVTVSGVLKCWGFKGSNNSLIGDGSGSDQLSPVVIDSGTSYKEVVSESGHTCAITALDVLKCWGSNQNGRLGNGSTTDATTPVVIDSGTTYESIAPGFSHTCGKTLGGGLKCWGSNSSGELGDGTVTQRTNPTTIQYGSQIQQLSLGQNYTCAVNTDGLVLCYGANSAGSLGIGRDEVTTPQEIDGNETYLSATLGTAEGCGLTASNQLKCWGGIIGDGSGIVRSHPFFSQPDKLYSDIAVATGQFGFGSFVCGISNSKLYCWGWNDSNQIDGSADFYKVLPTAIDPLTDYRYVATGQKHTCAITSLDKLKCWGPNGSGELGTGNTTALTSPTLIDSAESYSTVSLGSAYTCAITTSDVLKCWGKNTGAQLGDSSTTGRLLPTVIDSGTSYSNITTSRPEFTDGHSCGITTSNVLKCWGTNTYSQLGDGTTSQSTTPKIIDSGTAYQSVSVGSDHSCAVTTFGNLKCWGYNYYFQLGNGTDTNQSIPTLIDGGTLYQSVHLGTDKSLAITTSGKIKTWGNGTGGALGNGYPLGFGNYVIDLHQ